MLEGRSIYVWRLAKALGRGSVDDLVQKAIDHKLSTLWIKIADGDAKFSNAKPPLDDKLQELVRKARAAHIATYGYHVPHCADPIAAKNEARFVADLLHDFMLDGVVIDNEEGAAYFRGGKNEAHAYGEELKDALQPASRFMIMSSHDIVSAHPNAYASVIAHFIDFNAPQVYYGQSPTVKRRLEHAINENDAFAAPLLPVGALFIRETGKSDGGCADDDDCAQRARDFIALVSQCHTANPQRFPGYAFWNWEEAPAKAWNVLKTMPVFV
jgi:hypothetical protein